jgi:hypothetical protein
MLPFMDSRTVTITLQVEVDGDDVRGAATHVGGHGDRGPGAADDPRIFTGWLGLIGAIDALLGFPADAGAAARALATTQEGTQAR